MARNAKNKFNKNLNRALQLVGEKYVEEVKKQLVRDGNDATGRLVKSIGYKIVDEGIEIQSTRYGQAVDAGSAPAKAFGKVSYEFRDAIVEWAKAKGIYPKSGPSTEGNMRKMAYAIASKIQRDGRIGTQVFDRVYDKLEKEFGEQLMAAYSKDLTEKLNNIKVKK